ncbi:uncharacterized protein LOC111324891 [Stylophora pistillata]|nr:uncharacterized protein LOC111324891 [Stylophora pistillata]
MFDENLGIAVYAGYKLDQGTILFGQAHGATGWRREPGILIQGSDAIYRNQQYDRGHLVPAQTYSSSDARLHSTYKHTNAVPQVGAFNRGLWAQFEARIRNYAQNTCVPNNGVLFLLTGTSFARAHVVNNQLQSNSVQPNQLPPAQNYPSIFIPNSMWTAGCCVAPNGYSESFAVFGNNDLNHQFTEQITLNELQNILADDVMHTGLGGPDVSLFPGHVNCANNNLQRLPQAQGGG